MTRFSPCPTWAQSACITLRRQRQLAVLVVHDARKSAGRMRAGQALRGSSEFHAWGDSNLYLRRSGGELNLTVEHRAASPPTIGLELAQRGDALALEFVSPVATPAAAPTTSDERITGAITSRSPLQRTGTGTGIEPRIA